MAIVFASLTRHGRLLLAPGVATSFGDKNAENYFVRAGFAKKSSDKAVVDYPAGSVDIDPETVFADGPKKGLKVLEG
jgi:hypothetical protein